MRIIASTLMLKDDPDLKKEYLEQHKNVWPEVLAQTAKGGVIESKIFISGNQLFGVSIVEDDYDENFDYTENDLKAKEWDEFMRQFQQPVPEATENEWWHPMEEVYCFSEQYEKNFHKKP